MLKQINNTVYEMSPEEEAAYLAAIEEASENDKDNLAEAYDILMGMSE